METIKNGTVWIVYVMMVLIKLMEFVNNALIILFLMAEHAFMGKIIVQNPIKYGMVLNVSAAKDIIWSVKIVLHALLGLLGMALDVFREVEILIVISDKFM